ncbi:MAG TPA: hypothetical protein VKA31_08265 [Mariprofundaceae bacterium]|nr:hypothetical protein [Mariprofundaceae bacterium]
MLLDTINADTGSEVLYATGSLEKAHARTIWLSGLTKPEEFISL